jgi:L-amino acid N-acyltransferase YncA
MPNKQPITLRAATPSDIDGVCEIHTHYVLNTVITFKIEPQSQEEHLSVLRKVQDQNLPFIVAILNSKLVGYTYVSGFRSGKGGYKHTVELSLFVHPDNLYQGIGTLLLEQLIEVVSHPSNHPDFVSGTRANDGRVRHIIACMAVNTDGKDEGMGLKKWYEGFGFVLSGRLKEVGYKFDQW